MYNINYNNIIYLFKKFVEKHQQLKIFGQGEIYDIDNLIITEKKFPIMWSNLIDIQYVSDNVKSLNFNILFIDILQNGKENEFEIWNDQIQIAEDFIRFLKYNQQDNIFEIPGVPVINVFTENLSEFVAGATLNISINIYAPLQDDCGIPLDNIDINFPPFIPTEEKVTFDCNSLLNCQIFTSLSAATAQNTIDIATLSGATLTGNYLPLSGGTVTGDTIFTQGLSATTLSASTYLGLPSFTGAYLPLSGGTVTGLTNFTNGLSGSSISGDTFFSGGTPLTTIINNISNQYNPSGKYLPLSGGTVTGGTIFTQGVTANTISNVESLLFNLTATTTHTEGQLNWNNDSKTLEIDTENQNVAIEVGHQNIVRVVNKTGAPLLKGTVVYINGAQAQRPTVTKADYTVDNTSARTLGFVTADIADNNNGYVTTYGLLRNVNTSAYSAGTQLYLFSAGTVTDVRPQAPLHEVRLGYVTNQSATNGIIFIYVQNGYELRELHDVRINGITNNQLISYNSSLGVWENTSNVNLNSISGNTFFSGGTQLSTVINNIASQYNPVGRFLPLSGGTVTGSTSFTNGLNANTISATTYQNLPVTADTFTTGFTYLNNTFTISRNQGLPPLTASINTMTGLTVNGTLNATNISASTVSFTGLTVNGSISATTYNGLPEDILVKESNTTTVNMVSASTYYDVRTFSIPKSSLEANNYLEFFVSLFRPGTGGGSGTIFIKLQMENSAGVFTDIAQNSSAVANRYYIGMRRLGFWDGSNLRVHVPAGSGPDDTSALTSTVTTPTSISGTTGTTLNFKVQAQRTTLSVGGTDVSSDMVIVKKIK